MLWCQIRQQTQLLALLILGMRGDLDPYRLCDQHALQRLVVAASMAFANSAAYMHLRESEETIRYLNRHLQHAQDETGRRIARELHDEIINVHVRLNVQSLEHIARDTTDLCLRREIEQVLRSEQTVGMTLRSICEQLHPTGIDDPIGLPAVLRAHVQKTESRWQGQCRFICDGKLQPVRADVQLAALGIVREALTNASKHANATEITVTLRFPSQSEGSACLTITDNGQGGAPVRPKPGHWGLRQMQERALGIGGTLEIISQAGAGTTLLFCFPTAAPAADT